MNDADAIRHFLGDAELMRGEEDRHALERAFLENILHHARVMRIEPDHRLVDHEHLRVVQQRGHDRHALSGAVRQALDGFAQIRFEIETLDQHYKTPVTYNYNITFEREVAQVRALAEAGFDVKSFNAMNMGTPLCQDSCQ